MPDKELPVSVQNSIEDNHALVAEISESTGLPKEIVNILINSSCAKPNAPVTLQERQEYIQENLEIINELVNFLGGSEFASKNPKARQKAKKEDRKEVVPGERLKIALQNSSNQSLSDYNSVKKRIEILSSIKEEIENYHAQESTRNIVPSMLKLFLFKAADLLEKKPDLKLLYEKHDKKEFVGKVWEELFNANQSANKIGNDFRESVANYYDFEFQPAAIASGTVLNGTRRRNSRASELKSSTTTTTTTTTPPQNSNASQAAAAPSSVSSLSYSYPYPSPNTAFNNGNQQPPQSSNHFLESGGSFGGKESDSLASSRKDEEKSDMELPPSYYDDNYKYPQESDVATKNQSSSVHSTTTTPPQNSNTSQAAAAPSSVSSLSYSYPYPSPNTASNNGNQQPPQISSTHSAAAALSSSTTTFQNPNNPPAAAASASEERLLRDDEQHACVQKLLSLGSKDVSEKIISEIKLRDDRLIILATALRSAIDDADKDKFDGVCKAIIESTNQYEQIYIFAKSDSYICQNPKYTTTIITTKLKRLRDKVPLDIKDKVIERSKFYNSRNSSQTSTAFAPASSSTTTTKPSSILASEHNNHNTTNRTAATVRNLSADGSNKKHQPDWQSLG